MSWLVERDLEWVFIHVFIYWFIYSIPNNTWKGSLSGDFTKRTKIINSEWLVLHIGMEASSAKVDGPQTDQWMGRFQCGRWLETKWMDRCVDKTTTKTCNRIPRPIFSFRQVWLREFSHLALVYSLFLHFRGTKRRPSGQCHLRPLQSTCHP